MTHCACHDSAMDFNAALFSTAWLSVANAVGSDRDQPSFDRKIGVYLYNDRGVRLVGSDSFVLSVAWVPEYDDPAPPLTTEADEHWVCLDFDGRAKSLMNYVLQRCLARAKELDPDHVGFPGDVDDKINFHRARKRQIQQLHLVGMERPLDTVIDYMGEEHVALESLDGRYPGWESMAAGRVRGGSPTSALSLTASTMARLATLSKLLSRATGGEGGMLSMDLDGGGGTVMVTSSDVPGLMTFASSKPGARWLDLEDDQHEATLTDQIADLVIGE